MSVLDRAEIGTETSDVQKDEQLSPGPVHLFANGFVAFSLVPGILEDTS